ncbi:camk family protein kinase [Colletotrichum musicola]|uniref:Camk family protein kinase n=1 Tax=Colletotrichum musicola TaxID=2175873 RepID=A0A8H6NVM5_9PEZI|nr:camk family protein kinase [Colletotrichum musicola]
MDHPNVIAWLIPSSNNQPALEAVRLPHNASRRIASIPETYDPLPIPSDATTIDPSLLTKKTPSSTSKPALELSFSRPPKNHTGFVLGTDPACDILLPSLPGIAPRHCHIAFDAERRLIVRDTSATGTAVWYDADSTGDTPRGSWLLSSGASYGFPSAVDRVVIDVQSVRFQVVVDADAHLADPEAYDAAVDDFVLRLASLSVEECIRREELSFDLDFRGFGIDFCFDDLDFGFGRSSSVAAAAAAAAAAAVDAVVDDEDYDELDYYADYMDLDDSRDLFAAPRPPLPSEVAPVFVKYMYAADEDCAPDTYLWNTARPWEPMVKVTC